MSLLGCQNPLYTPPRDTTHTLKPYKFYRAGARAAHQGARNQTEPGAPVPHRGRLALQHVHSVSQTRALRRGGRRLPALPRPGRGVWRQGPP